MCCWSIYYNIPDIAVKTKKKNYCGWIDLISSWWPQSVAMTNDWMHACCCVLLGRQSIDDRPGKYHVNVWWIVLGGIITLLQLTYNVSVHPLLFSLPVLTHYFLIFAALACLSQSVLDSIPVSGCISREGGPRKCIDWLQVTDPTQRIQEGYRNNRRLWLYEK